MPNDAPKPVASARDAPDVVERGFDAREQLDGHIDQQQHADDAQGAAAGFLDEFVDVFGHHLLRGLHPRVPQVLRAGEERVAIRVEDNGIGIPPANLVRIFSHGFTTKKDGHGFGLHSGALAAKQLGGSLTVESQGANAGAVFTLELPISVSGTAVERMAS